MAVGATSGVTQNQQTGQTASSQAAGQLNVNYDTFLKLLIAQMQNQDPTNPMDPTQQVSQLATFSQVEQSIQTNKNLENLIASSALSEADAVIGRTLTSADGSVTGVVQQVQLTSSGLTAFLDTGDQVPVTSGVTVK
ncbi:MAG: flagellar hook assembly protein FlgD [Pararhizobium sp.]